MFSSHKDIKKLITDGLHVIYKELMLTGDIEKFFKTYGGMCSYLYKK